MTIFFLWFTVGLDTRKYNDERSWPAGSFPGLAAVERYCSLAARLPRAFPQTGMLCEICASGVHSIAKKHGNPGKAKLGAGRGSCVAEYGTVSVRGASFTACAPCFRVARICKCHGPSTRSYRPLYILL